MGGFTTVTSIPVFSVNIGSPEQPQPFRCGTCGRWITYCENVIVKCSRNEDTGESFACEDCRYFKGNIKKALKTCDQVVYRGSTEAQSKVLRHHYHCVKEDSNVVAAIKEEDYGKFVAPIPWVSGIGFLPEDR